MMHTEGCSSLKLPDELQFDDNSEHNNTLVSEHDLASSSSNLDEKNNRNRSRVESTSYGPVIYVNEDTMDCSYAESVGTPKNYNARIEVSSPEMFESDEEEEGKKDSSGSSDKRKDDCEDSSWVVKPTELTREQIIEKSDSYQLARMNKFLTGVPPPPKHTICQSDCSDFLARIRANRRYFLLDPLGSPKEKETIVEAQIIETVEKAVQSPCKEISFNNHRGKSSLRNLTNAFDACDRSEERTPSVEESESTKESFPKTLNELLTSQRSTSDDKTFDKFRENDANPSEVVIKDRAKHVTFKMPEEETVRFCNTIGIEEIKNIPWDLAYSHKTHGIHYNRSKTVEDFEGLTLKLCQRYIGAETQSSCNIWFTKQTPSSVKKRSLLSRRNNGQSPGKRLSHLARRRRTFSSANLQGLGMVDKRQLVLNIKKPTIRKGKSPRGKSPRGSAKKRASLNRISPSPRKAKLETSKRALFQSPPGDRAGPSGRATSLVNGNSQQRIKRALFPTSITRDDVAPGSNVNDIKRVLSFDETKKRKNEEELEGPKFKWAKKSLSFDCAHVTESNSSDSWTTERHSTGNFHTKSQTPVQQGKCELSETHRKKLLWAVAEALRNRGIGMGHPRFKQCASQLARTVKKYMPDLENPSLPRKPGSTSDRMLRLAKRHVLLIVESKSTE